MLTLWPADVNIRFLLHFSLGTVDELREFFGFGSGKLLIFVLKYYLGRGSPSK